MGALTVCLTLALFGTVTAAVAAARGFEPPQWFVAGLVAGPLALVVLWSFSSRRPKR